MPEHLLALLDTSCAIEFPARLEELAEAAAISTLTVAELAYGMHHGDPFVAAAREARYRALLEAFDPSRTPLGRPTSTAPSPSRCEMPGGAAGPVAST